VDYYREGGLPDQRAGRGRLSTTSKMVAGKKGREGAVISKEKKEALLEKCLMFDCEKPHVNTKKNLKRWRGGRKTH